VLHSSCPAELDALALEPEEEEGPSYLADLNRVPDFVDEPPTELGEVCTYGIVGFFHADGLLTPGFDRHQRDKKL